MTGTPLIVVDDALFDDHSAPPQHPERPERLRAARAALQQVPEPHRSPRSARDATADELVRVHTERYIELLGSLAGKTGYLDSDTFYAPRSVAAATRAAGAGLVLVESLLQAGANALQPRGDARAGITCVRPPGHHALPDSAMGFCLLNNVAVAAAHARQLGAQRVAILDWDVHHGNGTQDIFWADPQVLFISTHQFPLYPGTGALEELGHGDGRGFTVNVPLSAGAGDAVYQAAMSRVIAPILEQYKPDLLLISAGFDAHKRDPLAQMELSDAGYAALMFGALAALPENTPVGLLLEGGYDLSAITSALRSTLNVLLDPQTEVPKAPSEISWPHAAELERAQRVHAQHWKL